MYNMNLKDIPEILTYTPLKLSDEQLKYHTKINIYLYIYI